MVGGITSSVLEGFYRFGKDSRLVGLSTDLASLTVRSPMTLLDTKTDKETRTHAALWQATDYSLAIVAQATVFPFVPKVGNFLARNVFKFKDPKAMTGSVQFFNFFLGYFLCTSVILPLFNSKYMSKMANYVSEKLTGKQVMPNADEMQAKRKEEFQQQKAQIRSKIRAFFDKVLGKPITNGTISAAKNTANIFNIITKPITYPVTKISEGMASLIVSSLNGLSKLFRNKELYKDKQKAKENTTKFFKRMIYTALSFIPLSILAKKFGPSLGKKIEGYMVKENNISSTTTLIRTRIADGTAKPFILLSNGSPYMALRKVFDQIVSVIFLKTSTPVINKTTKFLTQKMNLDPRKAEGLQTMLITLFQNLLLLNIALPLFNNEVTGRLFKKIFKNKKDANQDHQAPQQSPAQSASNTPGKNNSSPFNVITRTQGKKTNSVPLTPFEHKLNQSRLNQGNIFAQFEKISKPPGQLHA